MTSTGYPQVGDRRAALDAELVDVRQQGRERLYQPRLSGLEGLRQELESYWNHTLSTFKSVAEQSYEPTASDPEGTS